MLLKRLVGTQKLNAKSFKIFADIINRDFRGVVIDDRKAYEKVLSYVEGSAPALADRISFYDMSEESLPLFERHHVYEQLHKTLDQKVWLPSGGSLIVQHTEALTVIDVNTAEEIARQLRLRDIGGIIVIDFVDMEIKENREQVAACLRDALARDKTRTQVVDISELGLVEMTRKRIGEGLLESFSLECEICEGRGVQLDKKLLDTGS